MQALWRGQGKCAIICVGIFKYTFLDKGSSYLIMTATTTMTREERMATQPIGRLMVSMTFPAILAQIINVLYSVIDRIYIGHMEGVGASALTGVGVTFCITMFVSAFSAFISNGAAPLAAIWLGKVTEITRRGYWATASASCLSARWF